VPLNSVAFLACFGVFAVVYYAAPPRAQRMLLLAASLAFYATFNPWNLAPLTGVAALAYVGGLAIGRARSTRARALITAAVVASVLGVLTAGKFGGAGLLAAAGVSFYTFSAISYVVDVYRGQLEANRRFVDVALYLAYFPKLLAGPIERATTLLPRLATPVRFDDAQVVSGLQQMLWGLFKKVVIADRLAVLVDRAYAQPQFGSPADLMLATYAFAFQLYCDFSGYSDIAIGASRVLGLELAENFRRPYMATSVSEFWARRWHLSLSAWFRDYVYVPIGGGRVALPRRVVNLLTVFVLSGAWHGASWTYVVWGGLNGVYVAAGVIWRRVAGRGSADRAPESHPAVVTLGRRVATFHLVLVSWVFFRAASVEDALTVLTRIAASVATLPSLVVARLQVGDWWLPIGLVVLLLAAEWVDERQPVWDRLRARPTPLRWTAYYAIGLALLVLGVWSRQQFVYMQF
jgi:D-alanyl-lipoteichoic acid acyltransferase DltB (MBOAT superfamily)